MVRQGREVQLAAAAELGVRPQQGRETRQRSDVLASRKRVGSGVGMNFNGCALSRWPLCQISHHRCRCQTVCRCGESLARALLPSGRCPEGLAKERVGLVFHVMNRGARRLPLFDRPG